MAMGYDVGRQHFRIISAGCIGGVEKGMGERCGDLGGQTALHLELRSIGLRLIITCGYPMKITVRSVHPASEVWHIRWDASLKSNFDQSKECPASSFRGLPTDMIQLE